MLSRIFISTREGGGKHEYETVFMPIMSPKLDYDGLARNASFLFFSSGYSRLCKCECEAVYHTSDASQFSREHRTRMVKGEKSRLAARKLQGVDVILRRYGRG